jgi:chromosome segregation ATPase
MPASAVEVENQALRRTVETLRLENERLAAEREESLQRATLAHGELAQLRETAIALREQLDAVRLEEQERGHRALAAAQGEVTHLREAIVALRDQLEATRVASEANVRHAMVAARDEVAELQQTIVTLHQEIEKLRVAKDAIAHPTAAANRGEVRMDAGVVGSTATTTTPRRTGAIRDADS